MNVVGVMIYGEMSREIARKRKSERGVSIQGGSKIRRTEEVFIRPW